MAWRVARVALALLLVASGYWLLSASSVANLLALDARERASPWATPDGTPWHWSLQGSEAVVWPGSSGFERDPDSETLSGVVPSGIADLSMALGGERIDPMLVTGAILELTTSSQVLITLLGESTRGTTVLGSASAPGDAAAVSIPFHSHGAPPLLALRLRLETDAGAHVALGTLRLPVAAGVSVTVCEASTDITSMLDHCASRVPSIASPLFLRPERLLDWRDRVLAERPAAIVQAHPTLPRWIGPAAAIRRPLGDWPYWILAAMPLVAVLLSHASPRPGAARAMLELALVCGPWLILLWCGWPADDPASAPTWTFVACLLGALLVRDPAPDWTFFGTRSGWSAAAWLLLLAHLVLLGAAAANAFDGDGFAVRSTSHEDLLRYPAWALVQQLILMRTIAPRMRLAFGSESRAALAAGALFGLLHLPNLSLMLATFAAGTGWAWLGYRFRALLPLVLTHALLGLALFALAPPWLLRSAEIGGRFLMSP